MAQVTQKLPFRMENLKETAESVMFSPSRRAETYSRNVAKKARHSGQGKVPSIACKHHSDKVCQASALSAEDVTKINRELYSTTDKVKQDAALLTYMHIMPVKRRRPKAENKATHRTRDLTVKYCVLTESGKIPVCKASFMSIFCKYC